MASTRSSKPYNIVSVVVVVVVVVAVAVAVAVSSSSCQLRFGDVAKILLRACQLISLLRSRYRHISGCGLRCQAQRGHLMSDLLNAETVNFSEASVNKSETLLRTPKKACFIGFRQAFDPKFAQAPADANLPSASRLANAHRHP